MELALVSGVTGLLLLLVAFVLGLFNILNQKSELYNVLNLLGALLLAVYAYSLSSIPFLILESVWGCFALYKLITLMRR